MERSPSPAAESLHWACQSSPSGIFLDPEEALRSQLWQAGTPALHALATSFSTGLVATTQAGPREQLQGLLGSGHGHS